MSIRLGQILIEHGVLTSEQCDRAMDEQGRTGQPFGLICEQLFNTDPRAVEHAWAEQYSRSSTFIDPASEIIDPLALDLVTRRQAWQFRVMPLRFDGRELVLVTTPAHLRRALRFATAVIGVPVFIVLATPQALGEALQRHYPLPGLGPTSVTAGCLSDRQDS